MTTPAADSHRPLPRAVLLALAAAMLPVGFSTAAWAPSQPQVGSLQESDSNAQHIVVSEVMTGGASASDEFIELYNPTGGPLPLEGLEVVYVTASGATVTRKASWAAGAAPLDAGAHLLLANELGEHATIADLTYSGGLAATGGSVALRIQGAASAIDAVGWGAAASTWLEGSPATAPAAGSSIERLPGGSLGSGQDSDDNLADFSERAVPDPQGTASEPVLPGTPPPASPSQSPSGTASASPTPPASPTPTESPTGTPTPSAEPVISISSARALPDGTTATIEGVSLTDGAFTDGGGYLADASGGIAVLVSDGTFPRGQRLRVSGILDDRYHQRTLRASSADLQLLGSMGDPEAQPIATGAVAEGVEGELVRVIGSVVSSATQLSTGVAFDVDDGSGPTRLLVNAASGIDASTIVRGNVVDVVGVVGQRDSSGSGTSGYRVQPRDASDLLANGPATTPSAQPSGSAAPSASPPNGAVISIASARSLEPGAAVRIRGVVTLGSALLGDGYAAIQDETGAIALRLSDDAGPLRLGQVVAVEGVRSTKSGMETVRVSAPPTQVGTGPQPAARDRGTGELGEVDEAMLVVVQGAVSVAPRKSSAQNVYFDLDDGSGPVRVFITPQSGIDTDGVALGSWLEVIGVLGQETTGRLPERGYRIWPRGPADLTVISGPETIASTPMPSAGPGSAGSGTGSGKPAAGGGEEHAPVALLVPRLAAAAVRSSGHPSPKPGASLPTPPQAAADSPLPGPLAAVLLGVVLLGLTGSYAAARPGLGSRLVAATGWRPAGDRVAEPDAAHALDDPHQASPLEGAVARLVPLRVVDADDAAAPRHDARRILPPT